jgi:hypothetical protein
MKSSLTGRAKGKKKCVDRQTYRGYYAIQFEIQNTVVHGTELKLPFCTVKSDENCTEKYCLQ